MFNFLLCIRYTQKLDSNFIYFIFVREEISAIRKNLFLDAVAMSFECYASRACIFLTVVTYALLGNDVTAEKVFMILAFYNDMRFSLGIAFPIGEFLILSTEFRLKLLI